MGIASVFTATAATSCTDFSSLAAVFDQYRINMIEIRLTPHAPNAFITSTQPVGQLYTVLDYDDATALASGAAAVAYSDCIVSPPYANQRRCFRPRVALAAYSGAFTSYANVASPWIDASSSTVNHYGVKTWIDPGAAGALAVYDLVVRTHFEFRSTR
jgi:hypothetical protein